MNLPAWLETLGAERRHFEATGYRYCVTLDGDDLSDYLATQSALAGPDLDAAVHSYAATGSWPALSPSQTFFLCRRMALAAVVIELAIDEGSFRDLPGFPPPPEFAESTSFAVWALNEIWAWRGDRHLRDLAKTIFATYADVPVGQLVLGPLTYTATPDETV